MSCVTNGEFYLITVTRKGVISNENSNESSGFLGNFSSFRNGIPIGKAVDFYKYKIIGKSDCVWVMRIWIFSWFIILGEKRILELLDETFFMAFSQSLIS